MQSTVNFQDVDGQLEKMGISSAESGSVKLGLSKIRNIVMAYTAECEEEIVIRKLLKQQTNKTIPGDPMEIPFVNWVVKFLIENGFHQLASQYKTSLYIALQRLTKQQQSQWERLFRPWLQETLVDQVTASTCPPAVAGEEDRTALYHQCLTAVPPASWQQLTSNCQQHAESGKPEEVMSIAYKWLHQSCGKQLLKAVTEKLNTSDVGGMCGAEQGVGQQQQQQSPFTQATGTPGLLRQSFASHLFAPPTPPSTADPAVAQDCVQKMLEYFVQSLKRASTLIWDDLQLSYLKFIGQEILEAKLQKDIMSDSGGERPERPPPHGGKLLVVDLTFKLYLAIQLHMPLAVATQYHKLKEEVGESRTVEAGCAVLHRLHSTLRDLTSALVVAGELPPPLGPLGPLQGDGDGNFNTLHWIQYYNSVTKLLECDDTGTNGGPDCTFLLPQSLAEFQVMNDAYRFALQQCVPHDPVIRRLELDYQHPLFGTANLLDELGKYVMVVLRGGKIVLGFVRSVDQHTNVVLEHTIERVHVGDSYGEMRVGTFLIRGDNIILLCEVDTTKEMLLPRKLSKLPVDEIMFAQKAELKEKEEKRKKMVKILKEHQLPLLEIPDEDAF